MKKAVILAIDTSLKDTVVVSLIIDHKKTTIKRQSKKNKAQNTLPLIEEILKQEKISLKDLTEIKVNIGPGSFVGIRVGVSIANTLGFILNIPVNGQKRIVFPLYQ